MPEQKKTDDDAAAQIVLRTTISLTEKLNVSVPTHVYIFINIRITYKKIKESRRRTSY